MRWWIYGAALVLLGWGPDMCAGQDPKGAKPGVANPYTRPLRLEDYINGSKPTAKPAPAIDEVLNTRLQALKGLGTERATEVDPALRTRLNVRRALGPELGLLLQASRLPWPGALVQHAAAADRARVEKGLTQAVQQVRAGELSAETLAELSQAIEQVVGDLRRQANEMPTIDYLVSKRFVTRLQDSAKVLNQPGVGADLAAAEALPAASKTIPALVRYLFDKGLRFAPPLPGDDLAYDQVDRLFVEALRALPREK